MFRFLTSEQALYNECTLNPKKKHNALPSILKVFVDYCYTPLALTISTSPITFVKRLLAPSLSGNLLASFTRTCDTSNQTCQHCDTRQIFSSHRLSIYSATADSGRATRQYNPNLIAETVLPNFKPSDRIREAGIVVQASWSPCGVYIACGTDDDRVYVYDHRFIGTKPLLTFTHSPTSMGSKPGNIGVRRATTFDNQDSTCCFVQEKRPEYGVTALSWLESRFDGRGLVSGGSDGKRFISCHYW
jgi:hypothetical protein